MRRSSERGARLFLRSNDVNEGPVTHARSITSTGSTPACSACAAATAVSAPAEAPARVSTISAPSLCWQAVSTAASAPPWYAPTETAPGSVNASRTTVPSLALCAAAVAGSDPSAMRRPFERASSGTCGLCGVSVAAAAEPQSEGAPSRDNAMAEALNGTYQRRTHAARRALDQPPIQRVDRLGDRRDLAFDSRRHRDCRVRRCGGRLVAVGGTPGGQV